MANEIRLIDANALIKELDSFVVNPPFAHPATPWHRGITLAAETALRMPIVDAKPVAGCVDVKKAMEWLQGYTMTDTEQVYSNGTVYVPLYRVQQAFVDKAYNGLYEG